MARQKDDADARVAAAEAAAAGASQQLVDLRQRQGKPVTSKDTKASQKLDRLEQERAAARAEAQDAKKRVAQVRA